MRRLFLLVAAVGSLAACSPDANPTEPAPTGRLRHDIAADGAASSIWRGEFIAAADGLLYGSEGDYPFEPFFVDAAESDSLTAESFRRLARIEPQAPIDARTLDRFFARHIELVPAGDPTAAALIPRYLNLRETLRGALMAPSVYCVGRVALNCYIVGLDEYGRIDGMVTVSIET